MTDNGPFVFQLNLSQEITDTGEDYSSTCKILFFVVFFVFASVVAAYERR